MQDSFENEAPFLFCKAQYNPVVSSIITFGCYIVSDDALCSFAADAVA